MAEGKTNRVLGHALLGLGIGIFLFAVFYIVTYREGISQRFEWGWVLIHLSVLLGPAVLMGLWGAKREASA